MTLLSRFTVLAQQYVHNCKHTTTPLFNSSLQLNRKNKPFSRTRTLPCHTSTIKSVGWVHPYAICCHAMLIVWQLLVSWRSMSFCSRSWRRPWREWRKILSKGNVHCECMCLVLIVFCLLAGRRSVICCTSNHSLAIRWYPLASRGAGLSADAHRWLSLRFSYVLSRLLFHCNQVLYNQTLSWLLHGSLVDPHKVIRL